MQGMGDDAAQSELVGRARPLARLGDVVDRSLHRQRSTVLVAGSGGIGKTSLIRAAMSGLPARVGWGTCVEGGAAPGYWPWTQLLIGLTHAAGIDVARRLAGEDLAMLATIVPPLGEPAASDGSERSRLLLMDAAARYLDALAVDAPLVVVVDDLQWADESTLVLLDFITRAAGPPGRCVIGAYRDDELTPVGRRHLGPLVARSEHIELDGLDSSAVRELVERVSGSPIDERTAEAIHRRTAGHPFFVREVALAAERGGGSHAPLPDAVRDAIDRKLDRLGGSTQAVIEAAAVAGRHVNADVIASALDVSTVEVAAACHAAAGAGVLVVDDEGTRFAHDLWREAITARLPERRRLELHVRIGDALEERRGRTGESIPAELARHFTAAVALDGPERATHWCLEAARADCAALAFGDAAAILRRLRAAIADAGGRLDDARQVDVLLAEADALARAGIPVDARGLLRAARGAAGRCGDPGALARVALASTQLGARFAARRDEVVAQLEDAARAVAANGTMPALEAQVTAALARELQHSVAADRPRAAALSEHALELGRRTGDAATLGACLLARHDVLWTAGTAVERASLAREIVSTTASTGDLERRADGLLLLANALLEQGSPAHRSALDEYLALLDQLGQPRHRYLATTRRACVLLLGGDLAAAERSIDAAVALGERIREPDTGNVAMSQRLELVLGRRVPTELREFAAAAIEHWTGAPVHAHAVAAGFYARAGDLGAAEVHVATVVDLGTWRADRSYLWSVFVRELAHAAIALRDADLCRAILDDIEPVAGWCGVNGAVVAFAGSHAQTAGALAAALGRGEEARAHLERAIATYRRLGAPTWLADAQDALASMSSDGPSTAVPISATKPSSGTMTLAPQDALRRMRRDGDRWQLDFDGRSATVAHTKGLADIARLISASNVDVHVLDLVDAADRSGRGPSLVDRHGLEAYRRRLVELDVDADDAARDHDDERGARVAAERQALLDEVGRVTGVGGRARQFANHPAERARKAVSGRIRDAIRRIEPVLPALATHLEQRVVTGSYCRYRSDDGGVWTIESSR
jgi:hypothetical protein